MNAKRIALFGTSAVVLGGALVYALGIYPAASSRDGQGAIGKRDVYRAVQPADANVNPDAAPVAAEANAKEVKDAPELQDGQMDAMRNGQMLALKSGQMLALRNGQMLAVKSGQMVAMRNGEMFAMRNGQMMALKNGQMLEMQNGMRFQMRNGQLLALRNEMHSNNFSREMKSGQMNSGQMRSAQMNNGNFAKQ
jgi:hypothetical protein